MMLTMAGNFHEKYAPNEVKLPSERSTGLVFAVVAAAVAVLWRDSFIVLGTAIAVSMILVAISVFVPFLLKPLNILWFRFGLLMHRIVNPIIMLAVFALVFVPAGFIMRRFRDPLRSRRISGTSSYWVDRRLNEEGSGSMANQF